HTSRALRSTHLATSWRRHAFSFFFSSSGAHRDLHSFPTRRSSDLGGAVRARGVLPRRAGTRERSSRRDRLGELAPERAPSSARRDRKSTRLNSSHVKISYAVFCLKKKKRKHETAVSA